MCKYFNLKFMIVTIWWEMEAFERNTYEASRLIVIFCFLAWAEGSQVFVLLFFLKCTFVLETL